MEKGAVQRKKKSAFVSKKDIALGWIFGSLPLLGVLIFSAAPIGISFVAQFTSMQNNDLSTMTWNNFENFSKVFQDPIFWHSIKITMWLMIVQVYSVVVGCVIAYLLNKVKGTKLFRVIAFLPNVTAIIVILTMFKWVFDWKHGVLNEFLGMEIHWLADASNPQLLTWAILFVMAWAAPAYGIILYGAAFRNINPALYEACEIDGGNEWVKFWHISIPGILPTLLYMLVMGIISGFTVFDFAQGMVAISTGTPGGIDNMAMTIMYYIYIQGVDYKHMEYAAVMSWILFVVVAVLSVLLFRLRKKAEEAQ